MVIHLGGSQLSIVPSTSPAWATPALPETTAGLDEAPRTLTNSPAAPLVPTIDVLIEEPAAEGVAGPAPLADPPQTGALEAQTAQAQTAQAQTSEPETSEAESMAAQGELQPQHAQLAERPVAAVAIPSAMDDSELGGQTRQLPTTSNPRQSLISQVLVTSPVRDVFEDDSDVASSEAEFAAQVGGDSEPVQPSQVAAPTTVAAPGTARDLAAMPALPRIAPAPPLTPSVPASPLPSPARRLAQAPSGGALVTPAVSMDAPASGNPPATAEQPSAPSLVVQPAQPAQAQPSAEESAAPTLPFNLSAPFGFGQAAPAPAPGPAPGASVGPAGPAMPQPGRPDVRVDQGGDVTVHLDNVDVRRVLEMFSRSYALNILVAPNVAGNVTANFEGVPINDALQAVLRLCDLAGRQDGRMLYVYPQSSLPQDSMELKVIPLDFASAEALQQSVQAMLSPSGKVFISTVDDKDNRRTKEALVVTDLAAYVRRVESYVTQMDHAPRQVMIEAHVLEVALDHDERHGVNYSHLLGDFELNLAGMANPASSPAFFASIDTRNVTALLDCLRSDTDSKTLASPKVMVVNGQTARIQVGRQIGYKVVTATAATAVEEVQFLDVGVVLEVTPRITRDNRIIMRVKPQVSTGAINPDTEVPEEETRELETDVLLANGNGVVIGGLIQESDVHSRRTTPVIGDIPVIGRFLTQRQDESKRSEIIVTLVPQIVTTPPCEVLIDEQVVPVPMAVPGAMAPQGAMTAPQGAMTAPQGAMTTPSRRGAAWPRAAAPVGAGVSRR